MKRTYRLFLALICLMAGANCLFSEEKMVLTLEESLKLALSQNPFHLASKEKVDGAQSMVREAASRFFPSLNAQGLHILDEKLFVLEFPSFIPGQPPQRAAIRFTKDYQASLSFSMPIFTGGRLVSGYKQAQYNLEATKEGVKQSKQETVFNVKRAFYSVLLARKFVEVSEEAVALAEKHLQTVRSLHEVGMASRFDLLRSEVQAANLKPQFIRARNGLDLAELNLKTVIGVDLSQPVEVRGELIYESFDPDLKEAMDQALLNRPEVSRLRYQRQMAGEMLKMARAARLPSLAVAANYNFWADRFHFREDNWQSFYSVNLVLTFPLFSGFASSARIGQSKAAIKEIEFMQQGFSEMVKLEVRQAFLNLKQARESLLSQGKNVEQAEESVRIAELQFSEGLATTLDVSSAQVALTQAKTNHTQALYEYVLSLAQLEKAMGIVPDDGESDS